ncbi:hypothetical protein BDR22DRAFT_888782 [Usnea florida]
MFLLEILHISLAWKLIILVLIMSDIKTFPLVWHLRLLNALRFVLPSQRAEVALSPSSIFQPLVTSSHCSLSEMDFNWHKSNSTYYSDLDIARTHLLCTLFSVGIDQARHEHGNPLLPARKPSFTIKLAAVQCSFKREIRPYQRYEMWSRVLAWDAKWLYTITHFVRRDTTHSDAPRIVCATAVSKCVFKSGRRTIPPEVLLHTSGLIPLDIFPRPLLPLPVHHHAASLAPLLLPLQQRRDVDVVVSQPDLEQPHQQYQQHHPLHGEHAKFVPTDAWAHSQELEKEAQRRKGGWTSGMIEKERRRGMEMVCSGDLDAAEEDFCDGGEVLGWHFDI